jgi:prephenate dehydrogenase
MPAPTGFWPAFWPARPTIGIVGFGAFGQLMARELRSHARLVVHDPAPETGAAAARFGVAHASLAEVARAPVVVLAVPVAALAAAVAAVAPHVRPGALVLDVGSVKVGPAAVLAAGLPAGVDIVATHPLFGPESARAGVAGLRVALCPVRGRRAGRVAAFLRRRLGLTVIRTTPEAHDREAAVVQGLTHLVARVLAGMGPLPTALTTRSFDHLVAAAELVRHDAPAVFDAIARANPYAADVRRRFIAELVALDAALATPASAAEIPAVPARVA